MKLNAAIAGIAGMSVILCAAGAGAQWQTIDLDNYRHGQVLDEKALGAADVMAVNFHHAQSRLVAFDTRERGSRDPDLEGPNGVSGQWAMGNIDAQDIMGTVLIIQETGQAFAGYTDAGQSVVAQPDDEEMDRDGSRPGAGEITFAFDQPVDAFRFTLLDVERTEAFENETGSYVVVSNGLRSVKIAFAQLTDQGSDYFDPSVRFGDQSANRFPILSAEQLGLPGITQVVINLGGSGAVGELSYFVSEQETIGLASAQMAQKMLYGSGGLLSLDYSGDGPGFGSPGPGGPPRTPGPGGPGDEGDPPLTGVPTPGAAVAGIVLMSLLMTRRTSNRAGSMSRHATDRD